MVFNYRISRISTGYQPDIMSCHPLETAMLDWPKISEKFGKKTKCQGH